MPCAGVGGKQVDLTSRRAVGYILLMTTFTDTQRLKLAQLQTLVEDKPAHAEFLAVLLDSMPGEPLEDLVPSHGVARNAAAAIIADFEWIARVSEKPGMNVSAYPNAYKKLRIKQASSNAKAARTRADNFTWSGFSF